MATWDRPENMTTARTNITISTANSTSATGADLVGNAAAALAAASIVWETTNSTYAAEALIAAKDLYTFAQTVRHLHHLRRMGACAAEAPVLTAKNNNIKLIPASCLSCKSC